MRYDDLLDDALEVGPGGMVPRPDAVREELLPLPHVRAARMWDDGEPRRRPVKDAKNVSRRAQRKAKREARRANRQDG